jgi:hypothetical protein
MSQASRKLFQKFQKDFVQIPTQKSQILRFRPDDLVMHLCAHQCQEASNNLRLHPFKRHANTFERSSKFEKIPAFLRRHELRRQLTTGQHHPDAVLLWQLRVDKVQPSKL